MVAFSRRAIYRSVVLGSCRAPCVFGEQPDTSNLNKGGPMSQDSRSKSELEPIAEQTSKLLNICDHDTFIIGAFVIMALALVGPYVAFLGLTHDLCPWSPRSIALAVLGGLCMVSGCLLAGFIVNTWSKMRVADQEFILRRLEILAEDQKAV